MIGKIIVKQGGADALVRGWPPGQPGRAWAPGAGPGTSPTVLNWEDGVALAYCPYTTSAKLLRSL